MRWGGGLETGGSWGARKRGMSKGVEEEMWGGEGGGVGIG